MAGRTTGERTAGSSGTRLIDVESAAKTNT